MLVNDTKAIIHQIIVVRDISRRLQQLRNLGLVCYRLPHLGHQYAFQIQTQNVHCSSLAEFSRKHIAREYFFNGQLVVNVRRLRPG